MKPSVHLKILALLLLLGGCVMHNRMTSPVALPKEEQSWTYGLVADPILANDDAEVFGFQPIISYRAGLGKGNELGMTLYGVYLPGAVIDLKHEIYHKGNFTFSGDAALYGGVLRPFGMQYDLLFGSQRFYGVAGVNVDFTSFTNYPAAKVIGIGSEVPGKRGLGFQITYANRLIPDTNDRYDWLMIGLKMDFRNTKKKHRDSSKQNSK
ncbi:MAG: hypothetical protein RIC30_05600 [Marinoscillum sp.]|uniref:hypothetical protein n=1 Tax=Marinoscillum sp. TaxID=2024838 RepID=UPI0032F8A49F